MDLPVGSGAAGPSNVPAFLTKLWTLVSDPDTDALICWSPVRAGPASAAGCGDGGPEAEGASADSCPRQVPLGGEGGGGPVLPGLCSRPDSCGARLCLDGRPGGLSPAFPAVRSAAARKPGFAHGAEGAAPARKRKVKGREARVDVQTAPESELVPQIRLGFRSPGGVSVHAPRPAPRCLAAGLLTGEA